MQDTQGRTYAKLADLRAGDKLIADAGFSCLDPWSIHTIFDSIEGGLYIGCAEGCHKLSGQLTSDGYLIGLYPVATAVNVTFNLPFYEKDGMQFPSFEEAYAYGLSMNATSACFTLVFPTPVADRADPEVARDDDAVGSRRNYEYGE